MTGNGMRSNRLFPLALLAAATLACLLPFLGKPFNIDEPLFIWVARHLQGNWLDFYGFDINWYGTRDSAAEIIKNPPLGSYYIALAASLFGWSEPALHAAFLLPALAAVTGSYFLARELGAEPLAAALLVLFTPVFLVSATTVMCDVTMLACYVWAVYLWLRGLKDDSPPLLVCAALLVALASLTKYFGMSLIPLLFAYTLCRPGDRGRALFLLLPVAILCLYQWWTHATYGRGLLLDAASYATAAKAEGVGKDHLAGTVQGLSFLGGCFLPALLLGPSLWPRRWIAAALAAVPLLAAAFYRLPFPKHPSHAWWGYYPQLALFVTGGVMILLLALRDLRRTRDREGLLLFLWVAGTFLFASYLNWSVNGRSLLPMAPAVGILLARGMEREGEGTPSRWRLRSPAFLVPLLLGGAISLAVAWADYSLADTAQSAARTIAGNFGRGGSQLLFQGHWGFQYYMEQSGAVAWDGKEAYRMPLVMAVPEDNTNVDLEILKRGTLMQMLEFAPLGELASMEIAVGAGFYMAERGSLPFALGPVPNERYLVFLFR